MSDAASRQGDSRWLLCALREAVERLAAPAEVQLAWVRAQRVTPDELALDLDAVLEAAVARYRAELSHEVVSRLLALDSELSRMSGAANAALWTEGAVREHARWSEVRCRAAEALAAPGWPA